MGYAETGVTSLTSPTPVLTADSQQITAAPGILYEPQIHIRCPLEPLFALKSKGRITSFTADFSIVLA